MKSYFEKYESLLESNIQDFITDELHFGSCELPADNLNLLLRLSIPKRLLIGEGSHRLLSSTIRFDLQPESLSQLPSHFCKVIIVERLPLGVIADPFELQHLLERGGNTIKFSFKYGPIFSNLIFMRHSSFLGLIVFNPFIAVFSDVAVFGDTNLELPSFLSNQSVVEIHMNVGPDTLSGHMNELEIGIDLPLHARYPVSEKERMKCKRDLLNNNNNHNWL